MIIPISELIPDSKNANKHTERGSSMVQKSLEKYGAGRSILLDKNNNIIAGNLTAEEAGQLGMENVQIVESDGTKLIAVKRVDIDIDSAEGRGVYDPFLGSGTTMVAAQNLGRKCYGIEIAPPYCAVILQRMQDAFPNLEIKRITVN